MVADALGWRTLFFMNVPLGITLILAAALVLPTDGRRVPWAEFDALGFALLSGLLGLVGLLLLGPPGWAGVCRCADREDPLPLDHIRVA